MEINDALKAKINAAEPLTREQLDQLKKSIPRDAEIIWKCAQQWIKEYAFLVESAIVLGASGDIEQAVHHHKLSYQCLQVNGALMELARGEAKPMEHYLEPRRK